MGQMPLLSPNQQCRSTEDTDLNQKTAWLALSLSSSTIRLVTEGVLLQRLHGVILPYSLLLLLLLLHLFSGLFSRKTWVSRYQKSKTSPDLNEAREYKVSGCCGISWTTRKQFASRSRQITTSTPHQSIFTGQMLFLTPNQQCKSTEGNCHIYIDHLMSE